MWQIPTLYEGGFRTRTFANIFPSLDDFLNEITSSEITIEFQNEGTLKTLYYLLYARYGNSHISYSDENQFKYALYSIIFMYAPTWEKRLEIQKKLRLLSDNELMLGGKAIYNKAYNPGTPPSTDTLEELTTINEQNTTNYKKSKLEGWSLLISLLETDVTEYFISRFKKLFIKVAATGIPLLYETEVDDERDY